MLSTITAKKYTSKNQRKGYSTSRRKGDNRVGYKLAALAFMGLALVVAKKTNTNDNNISNIVDNTKISPAYIDWDLGIMLTEAKEYTGYAKTKNYIGYTDSKIITTWQKFYLQKSRYQGHQLRNKEGNINLHNSTVTIEVYGRMGKWEYHSVTNCNALMDRPNLNFMPVGPAGSGLLPITCGIVRPGNLPDYIHCNVIYGQSAIQAYNSTSSNGTITPIQTLSKNQTAHSHKIQNVYSPISRDAIASYDSMVFEKIPLNISQIKGVYIPEVEHMDNKITTIITLDSLQNMTTATMCSSDTVRLVLPIGGILMNGALLHCFDFEGEIVVTTKRNVANIIKKGNMDLANCNKIFDTGRFKLVLYDGSNQRTNTPIQYLYNLNMTNDGWNITCTSMYYQVGGSVDWNGWAQQFFAISNKYLWNYVNSCTVGPFMGPIQTASEKTLQYSVNVSAGFINVTQNNKYGGPVGGYGSNILLYPYPDWDSIGALEREEKASQIMKITTSSSGAWCLLNLAYKSSELTNLSDTPWEAVVANSTISNLVQLGINSGYGVNNVPTITQLQNEMEVQFSAHTLAASVGVAMTSIVAAYSANVFTLKIKFLKASNNTKLAIRIVISIIETAFADIAVITYMVALSNKGKACRNAKWYNTKMSDSSDDTGTGINNYVYTTADINGKADYWAAQWAILAIASAIVTTLITYRWHFSKGGTRSDWIKVVKEGEAKAEQKEMATQCSKHIEVQLPMTEGTQTHKRVLRTTKSS